MVGCKISVIVPVYRAERYIARCITSILNQTESDIELWLIDDGSPDQCGEICDAYAVKDSRVHVLHKDNAGVSAARNDGIKCSSGEYVTFVDADDYIEPDMLSILLKHAKRDNADIMICGYYVERNQEKSVANLCCADGTYEGEQKEAIFQYFYRRNYTGLASMCNKMYLRSFLISSGLKVDENLQRAEDFWFNFDAVRRAARVSIISTPLYHYIQNPDSVMHSHRPTQFEEWTKNRQRLLEFANKNGVHFDKAEFYYGYVYNSVLFLRELNYDPQKIDEIISNAFFVNASKETSNLPLHIRIITFCIEHRFCNITKFLLRIWALHSGE